MRRLQPKSKLSFIIAAPRVHLAAVGKAQGVLGAADDLYHAVRNEGRHQLHGVVLQIRAAKLTLRVAAPREDLAGGREGETEVAAAGDLRRTAEVVDGPESFRGAVAAQLLVLVAPAAQNASVLHQQ